MEKASSATRGSSEGSTVRVTVQAGSRPSGGPARLNCYDRGDMDPLPGIACGCIALAGYVIINGRKHGEYREAQARSPVLHGRKR